ncbi:hypothetical protein AAFF_G00411380 [Aldrovandia affinis]|uniref:MI domain-containing protein n=1 Tax=Aldrovandia affinis TaxID=143900 RepID=A0AAD7SDL0_9TELE|nr:hypothetical protein AAFF_G00411380 [Aldrovandia affinis]
MSSPPQSSQARPHKKYDREFLLGLRFTNVSIRRPKWLPHISDVVLDKPSNMPLTPQSASPLTGLNCGSDFTPPFLNRGRQFVGGRRYENHSGETSQYYHLSPHAHYRDSYQKARNPENSQPPQMDSPRFSQHPQREEPRKIIPSIPLGSDVRLNQAENAWRPVARKLAVRDRGEADHKAAGTQELLCQMRSILNKLTPERFHSLAHQVAALAIDTAERLKGVVELVFEKAISEPKFSVTYASMCRCLMKLNVPTIDSSGDALNFCSLLLDLCWKEFKKVEKNGKIFRKKQQEQNSISMDEATVQRQRSLGNMRFIGELFKLKMVGQSVVQDCVAKLLIKETEEALECLSCLLSTSGKCLDCDKVKPHMDQYFKQIEEIIKEKKMLSRIRFLLQDILELRQNNWVPRRKDQGPKTIDQIHKEAKQEKQQEQMKVQQQLLPKRETWVRGGSHPTWGRGALPQDEGWISCSVSSKNHPIDTSQFGRITKLGALDINNLLFITGGEDTWRNWSRGSNGGSRSKCNGEPGCFTTPLNCCSTLQKPLSFTPTSRTTDCYRRVIPRFGIHHPSHRNSWKRDCGEHSDRFDQTERPGRRSDRYEQQNDRGLERHLPISNQSHNQETEECVWERDYCSPGSAVHKDRQWNRSRRDRDQPVSVQPNPARPIMTEDKLEKKSKAIIEEYLHISDMKEALLCVQEMDCVPLLFVFVRKGIELALDCDAVARERTGHLLHQLVKAGTLPAKQFYKGMQEILTLAEDMEIDIPHIWLYLAEIIAPVLRESGLPMGQLFREVSNPLVPLGKASILLVEILLLLCRTMTHEMVGEMWMDAGLSWKDFLPEDKDVRETGIEKICCGCAMTHCPLRM